MSYPRILLLAVVSFHCSSPYPTGWASGMGAARGGIGFGRLGLGEHGEIELVGFVVGGVEILVAAVEAFEIEVLVIGELRMDADDGRDANVGAHIALLICTPVV